MNPINRKPNNTTRNVFYGVDINDKAAVQKEYEKLQKQHRKVTIIVVIVLLILSVIGFDFVRVNFMEAKPFFATSKRVEGGTLFSGLGYKVLYCENGERYLGSVLYKNCENIDMETFSEVVYNKFKDYVIKKKIVNENELKSLKINEIVRDEDNDASGGDYLLDITYECNDGSNKCFKTDKEFNSNINNKVYIRFNKYNEIYDLLTFKNSGEYYKKLNDDYTIKVRDYLIQDNRLNLDNVKEFKVRLVANNGKYKFRGNVYADSYLITVNYTCKDNSNECVTVYDKKDLDGDYANLSFNASMFLDDTNNVLLVGPREYLEID